MHRDTVRLGRRAVSSLPAALVATALLAIAATAAAQIGLPPSAFAAAVGADAADLEAGEHVTARGVRVEPERLGSALYAVAGEADLDDDALLDMGRVIAVATGLGSAIEGPVQDFLRTLSAELAGLGPVVVGVDRYRLRLEVSGDGAPHRVAFRIALAEVAEAAFPPGRHAVGPDDAVIVIREFSDAAEASECTTDGVPDDPGASWRYHDALFESQAAWSGLADPTDYFVGLAEGAHVDADAVATCIAQGARSETVEEAYAASVPLQLSGTPTVFVNGYQIADFTDLDANLGAIALVEAFAEREPVGD